MKLWVISSSYPRHPTESINAGVLARGVALGGTELGHQVTVITPDKPGGVVFDDELSGVAIKWPRPTVALTDLNPRNPLQSAQVAALLASARRTLRRQARVAAPDGIIALWGIPSGIFARWASHETKAAYVTWLLGSDVWKAKSFPRGVNVLSRVLGDSAGNFADGSELASLATELTGQPVETLWSARALPPSLGREASSAQDILFVGRYHTNKGPDVLLEALALAPDGGQSLSATFHGQGEMDSALRRRADDLGFDGQTLIRGPIDAGGLRAALETTRVLVVPSRVESVPLILGDAIQAGCAVVVTACGDMGQVVDEYGLGVVVPPEDPAALERGIRQAISGGYPDPRGLERARQQFSPAEIAKTLIDRLG